MRIVVVAAKQLRFRVGRKNGAHHPDSILRVCKIIYRWTSFFSRAPFYFLMAGFPRMPYLSSHMQAMKDMFMNVDKVEQLPSPRVIRPHLPFYLLPPQLLDTAKVENPKIQ